MKNKSNGFILALVIIFSFTLLGIGKAENSTHNVAEYFSDIQLARKKFREETLKSLDHSDCKLRIFKLSGKYVDWATADPPKVQPYNKPKSLRIGFKSGVEIISEKEASKEILDEIKSGVIKSLSSNVPYPDMSLVSFDPSYGLMFYNSDNELVFWAVVLRVADTASLLIEFPDYLTERIPCPETLKLATLDKYFK